MSLAVASERLTVCAAESLPAYQTETSPPVRLSAAGSDPLGPWKMRLYTRLRERAYPLLIADGAVIPAASLWSGARLWMNVFREIGLVPGDRLLLSVRSPGAFVQVFIAALWEGLTIVPSPPARCVEALEAALKRSDARCAVSDLCRSEAINASHGTLFADSCEGPVSRSDSFRLREPRQPRQPEIRFLLQTSGTSKTTSDRFVALTDANVLSVLDSHLPLLHLHEEESRVLSVLPWHHAFGLVLDLLPALFSGAEVFRVAPDTPNLAAALVAAGTRLGATHLNAVPLLLKRIAATEAGVDFLRSLKGGIVGGAPVDAALASLLTSTQLRAGYGQTEAGPGIALGRPGCWPGAGYLGQALACDVALDSDGVLRFQGNNAYLGYWSSLTGLETRPSVAWVRTGDIVEMVAGDGGELFLFFRGRDDDAFKLSNGRRVQAERLEMEILRRHPTIAEAMLYSPDNDCLEVIVSLVPCPTRWQRVPRTAVIATALGSLQGHLKKVRVVSDDFWVRTPKGTRIRRACREKIECLKD